MASVPHPRRKAAIAFILVTAVLDVMALGIVIPVLPKLIEQFAGDNAQAGLIKGMSHITGGGFVENIPRVLPKGTGCYIDASAWELPPVFRFLMQRGGVAPLEMARTFNNGLGMVLVVAPDAVDRAIDALHDLHRFPWSVVPPTFNAYIAVVAVVL